MTSDTYRHYPKLPEIIVSSAIMTGLNLELREDLALKVKAQVDFEGVSAQACS
ncbi:hypothetical protein [Marinicella gelatinilytica]|uniref:hypothetical protein n=1 Tax=Marinicella gelatinilytica TaxID=2996017 RepID=UPI0022609849|nr:hypothetical protein [Marinicella gelatinilytica]MCX7545113.1 hypothetical protein [Marinicella gelatinilytica]